MFRGRVVNYLFVACVVFCTCHRQQAQYGLNTQAQASPSEAKEFFYADGLADGRLFALDAERGSLTPLVDDAGVQRVVRGAVSLRHMGSSGWAQVVVPAPSLDRPPSVPGDDEEGYFVWLGQDYDLGGTPRSAKALTPWWRAIFGQLRCPLYAINTQGRLQKIGTSREFGDATVPLYRAHDEYFVVYSQTSKDTFGKPLVFKEHAKLGRSECFARGGSALATRGVGGFYSSKRS